MIFLLLFLTACTQPKKVDSHFSGEAMTMPYHIHVAHPITKKKRDEIQQLIDETFAYANETYNHWNPNSELSQFNQLKAYEALLISQPLTDLFKLANLLHSLSKGRFDPSLRPLIQALKTNQKTSSARTGWDDITLKKQVATKADDSMQLDFDAISKGYTIDLMLKRLQQLGYHNLFIEWAGEIKASGQPEPNRAWTVAIRHPDSPYISDAIKKVALNNQAIATSGDYLQHYEHEGEQVSHIIDGQTGKPRPNTNSSVSVMANSCALADGLATTAMLIKDRDELKIWIKEVQAYHPEVQFWVLFKSQDPI